MATDPQLRPGPGKPWARLGLILLVLLPPSFTEAAQAVFTFTAAPDTLNRGNGTFTYDAAGTLTATFTSFQHDDAGSYPDHTADAVGSAFGVGEGPSLVSFSEPVELVELFVYNFSGDFDARPDDAKLFSVVGEFGGMNVFTYSRADESAPGSGVSSTYLRIAPDSPVLVNSLSFVNFDQDALDDLTVNIVPEPGGLLLLGAGLAGLKTRRSRRGSPNAKAGRAPPGTRPAVGL